MKKLIKESMDGGRREERNQGTKEGKKERRKE